MSADGRRVDLEMGDIRARVKLDAAAFHRGKQLQRAVVQGPRPNEKGCPAGSLEVREADVGGALGKFPPEGQGETAQDQETERGGFRYQHDVVIIHGPDLGRATSRIFIGVEIQRLELV
jgi:hypothetical protein